VEDLGHWDCNIDIPDDAYGFIYCITNTLNDRKYIGKKQFFRTIKRPPLKGRRNKRICHVESDWKTYTGSCNTLNIDISEHGEDVFTFKMLTICNSKWELAYEETKLQFNKEVLLLDEYYNGIINCRIGNRPKSSKDCS